MNYDEIQEIVRKKRVSLFFKRAFDIVVSGIGLLILSPIFIIVAFAIKIDSRGPVFFRQVRVGKNCKVFNILKFRTMVAGADKQGSVLTTSNDTRITKFGNFLRKTKIDELAQLFNVFSGKMSFVGPRPVVPSIAEMYGDEGCQMVYSVRPGITDLASIYFSNENNLLAGASDREEYYRRYIAPIKFKLVLEYISKMGFFFDIGLMFKTVFGNKKKIEVKAAATLETAVALEEIGEEIAVDTGTLEQINSVETADLDNVVADSVTDIDAEVEISNDLAENVDAEDDNLIVEDKESAE